METRYPNIEIELEGQDGNASAIIGHVKRALTRANVPAEEISDFIREATSNGYDNVIQTAMRWVNVS